MSQKTIASHISPDFDSIATIWLLKRFHPDFEDAKIVFVPAGKTLDNKPPDDDPDIIHIDTGGGRFDHHDTNKLTCAAELVWDWIKKEKQVKDEAVDRMVKIVTIYDHGKEVNWPDGQEDKYDFCFPSLISGWKAIYRQDTERIIEKGLEAMDAAYKVFQQKVDAEKVIVQGIKFETKWGKGLGTETGNEMVLHLGERIGYSIVVKKDVRRKSVRIYARNDRGIDLGKVYDKLREIDDGADWFLHASGCLLLNGSAKNPGMRPTSLSLEKIIEILEKA